LRAQNIRNYSNKVSKISRDKNLSPTFGPTRRHAGSFRRPRAEPVRRIAIRRLRSFYLSADRGISGRYASSGLAAEHPPAPTSASRARRRIDLGPDRDLSSRIQGDHPIPQHLCCLTIGSSLPYRLAHGEAGKLPKLRREGCLQALSQLRTIFPTGALFVGYRACDVCARCGYPCHCLVFAS
jgi:hypothetical protein